MNLDLYKVLVKELARTLDIQCASNPEVQAAGMVINTMGWVDGAGYEVNTFLTPLMWLFSSGFQIMSRTNWIVEI